jgi:hypothetical protein
MEASHPKKRGPKPKKGNGRFFAIDKHQWQRVCSYEDMNMAAAYFILGSGTNGKNHKTTKWSANAIRKYADLDKRETRRTITRLIECGFVQSVGDKPLRPVYELALSDKPEWIWLPNSLVEGIKAEGREIDPPLRQLMNTGDVSVLRELVLLYYTHDLENAGGSSVLWKPFTSELVATWEHCEAWRFEASDSIEIDPNYLGEYPDEQRASVKKGLEIAAALGLIEFIPHVFIGGRMLHPLRAKGRRKDVVESKEIEPTEAAGKVVWEILELKQERAARSGGYDHPMREAPPIDTTMYLVPIYRHTKGEVRAVARLRHRPNTSPTKKWVSNLCQEIPKWTARYEELAREVRKSRYEEQQRWERSRLTAASF